MLTLHSYAKLNLCLKVFTPRKDGYHPICSVFESISLHDTLTITQLPEKKMVLDCDHPQVPLDSDNFLVQAYNALRDRLSFGYHVKLSKRIPMGGGLGGGSSNVAAFLWALNRLESLNWSLPELSRKGLAFGADVPFFFYGSRALVRGIGEKITPLPIDSPHSYILIVPPIHMSTKTIYHGFDALGTAKRATKTPRALVENPLSENDLKPVVFSQFPEYHEIEQTVQDLFHTPLYLSGSGATVFFPIPHSLDKNHTLTLCKTQFPNYDIYCVKRVNYGLKEV